MTELKKSKKKINESLLHRIRAWKTFDFGYICSVRACDEDARCTDAGDLCLDHYISKPDCSVDGCYNPITNGTPTSKCCREHFIYGDGSSEAEYMEKRREEITSMSCTLGDAQDFSTGAIGFSVKNKKRDRKRK